MVSIRLHAGAVARPKLCRKRWSRQSSGLRYEGKAARPVSQRVALAKRAVSSMVAEVASKKRKQGADEDRSSQTPEERRAGFVSVVLAALVYGALFVAWTWPLALQARTHIAVQSIPNNDAFQTIYIRDQMLSVATAARNARSITQGRVGDLIDPGFCFPMPDSAALGGEEPPLPFFLGAAKAGQAIIAMQTAGRIQR